MPTKPPGRPSARTASRVTTPCRSISWRAIAWSRSGPGGRGFAEPRDERPPAGAGRRPGTPERAGSRPAPRSRRPDLGRRAPHERAERSERVVGDLARPHQVPQGRQEQALVGGPRRGHELRPERGTSLGELPADRVVEIAVGGFGRRVREERRRIRPGDDRHAPVVGSERSGADPRDVPGGHEGVEVGGAVAADAGREHVRFEDRRGDRHALQLSDGAREGVRVSARPIRVLPGRQEAPERRRVHRLDLASQHRERAAPDAAQHVRIAPLVARPARPEAAADDLVVGLERSQRLLDAVDRGAEPRRDLRREERAVRSREPSYETLERTVGLAGERGGEPEGERDAERVAEPGGVLHGGDPLLPRDPDADRASVGEQGVRQGLGVPDLDAGSDLVVGQVAERPQQVVQVVGGSGAAAVAQTLELELHLVEGARVEELPQLVRAEQLAQQIAIEREGGGAPLGERRVSLVHVDADPSEEQRLRERRRVVGVDGDEPRATRPEVRHHLAERRDVEDVLEALPRGLQQDREVGVLGRLRQEIGRALPLLPERRALAGPSAGEQERPRRRLAERAREHRGLRQRPHDQLLDRLGVEHEVVDGDPLDRLGQPHHDPVVAPQHLRPGTEPLQHPRLDRHRPGGVDARAERRQHAHPPVADLVAEAFDHDGPVVGDGAGGLHLLLEVGDEVARGPLVEADVATQALQRRVATGPRGGIA